MSGRIEKIAHRSKTISADCRCFTNDSPKHTRAVLVRLIDNLNAEVSWPPWLVSSIAPGTHVILQFNLPIGELRDWFDLDEGSVEILRFSGLEELRLKYHVIRVRLDELEHCGNGVGHCMIVSEHWRVMLRPDVLPYLVRVRAYGTCKPLRIVVQGRLRML